MESLTTYIASAIFILGYAAIALEHKLKISKSAVALFTGGVLWLLVAASGVSHIDEKILHAGSEIFGIVAFLLAAMSLVEILIHYRFFDVIRGKLYRLGLSEKNQFIVISLLAFVLSAIIDNLTTTIVMIQIARRFFTGENMLKAAAAIVIAANAGGAFSPIGDVTTIMLWLAEKFTAGEVIVQAFLPALTILAVTLFAFYRHFETSTPDKTEEIITTLGRSEKLIISVVFFSFTLPVLMNFIGLPPYIGLLLGLGLVWLMIDSVKQITKKETHLEASIEKFIKQTDIPSLKFFIGVLLAVAALSSLGILGNASHALFGNDPSDTRIIIGNVILGTLSAIVDNVPLTAIAIELNYTQINALWVLLALTAGTGGSMLIIGSAAGVVAMGMVKELSFVKYLRIATIPALLGFLAGIGVWLLQYIFFIR